MKETPFPKTVRARRTCGGPALQSRASIVSAIAAAVVAVDVVDVPPESTPLVGHWREIEHILGVPERLLPIHVHDGDQVGKLVVPANITASQTAPSLHSASLSRTKTRRSDASNRPARAAPAPIDRPWPREPWRSRCPAD